MWIALSLLAHLQPPLSPPAAPSQPAVIEPAATPDKAPDLVSADLEVDLAILVNKHSVPGLAAAVIVDGKVVRIGAAGKRARGESAEATANDLWHLGSCAKAMTATLAATFVERGELRWSMTLPELFPGEAVPPAWRDVTLENLLTHRSGLPANVTDQPLWASLFVSKNSTRDDRQKVLRWALTQQPACKPGEKFEYSNLGFMIAGHALETKADKAFEDLIQERLFTPLGITSAGVGAPEGNHPRGHRGPGPKAPPVKADVWGDNPKSLGPAGAFHMTISDWARFVAFHSSGELPAQDAAPAAAAPLLTPDLVKKLHTPPEVPGAKPGDAAATYALGWVTATRPWAKAGPDSAGRALMHNGSNTMWYCVTWVAPECGLAVVVACNQAGPAAEKACDEAAAKFLTRESRQKGKK